ncbi:MAG: hypothetical protein LBU32_20945 [Clostridiales bacterium]|nr:hypothetical protein [Clostridiales bacterium]
MIPSVNFNSVLLHAAFQFEARCAHASENAGLSAFWAAEESSEIYAMFRVILAEVYETEDVSFSVSPYTVNVLG